MLLDCIRLDIYLLLLLDKFGQLADDLVGDILHVLSTPRCVNPVDKRDMGELVGGGEAYDILPTRVRVLIDALHGCVALRANI